MLQNTRYVLPVLAAATDSLSQDIYSEQNVDQDFYKSLTSLLSQHLQNKGTKALILGGRCGFTTEILANSCSEIHVVQQEPYFSLLHQRFINKKQVDYFFGKQGEIGQRLVLPQPKIGQTVVRVIEAKNFLTQAFKFYDIILLQNWIVNDKVNLLKDFIKIDHSLLITMLIPGLIQDPRIFGFLSDMQKNILRVFYENIFYQQIKGVRRLTARKNQIFLHQVLGWKKKKQQKDNVAILEQTLQSMLVHFQNQKQQSKLSNEDNPFETQQFVDRYLSFHYGPEYFSVQNFPSVCSKIAIQTAAKYDVKGRALDLGCSVGRVTLGLADYFHEVVGVDLSNALIDAASDYLQACSSCKCQKSRIKFSVGNACDLDKSLGKFNLVFAGNLIEHLYDPKQFLIQIVDFLQPSGILIIASSYTWLQTNTPKARWLGGIIQNGVQIYTQHGLHRTLEPLGFVKLCDSRDLPSIMRQNEWVYQQATVNVTFWQKKAS